MSERGKRKRQRWADTTIDMIDATCLIHAVEHALYGNRDGWINGRHFVQYGVCMYHLSKDIPHQKTCFISFHIYLPRPRNTL